MLAAVHFARYGFIAVKWAGGGLLFNTEEGWFPKKKKKGSSEVIIAFEGIPNR